MQKRLFLCLWLAMAPWVQAADKADIDTATVDITIDLRGDIDAARFDPARGRVPVEGRTAAYWFKIDRPGRAAGDGWETGPNRSLVLARGAGSLQRAFGSRPRAPLPSAFVEPRLLLDAGFPPPLPAQLQR